MKKSHRKIKFLIILLIIIGLYFLLSESSLVEEYIANPETLRNLVLSFGILAPIAIILLQAFQTTISIIPSQITTIIAGFVFGPFLGLLYSLIGAMLGSALVFMLAKKYGKKLSLKLFDKKEIVHFNIFFRQKKRLALFLARIAPIFPNDLVSFAGGLTTISFRDFNIISAIGFVVQMVILTFFGAELASGKVSPFLIIITVLVSLGFLLLVFKEKLKRIFIKDFHKIEKGVEKEFKKI